MRDIQDKNTMQNTPPGGETGNPQQPVENRVIHPGAAPPRGQPTMTSAERQGVRHLASEFRRRYEAVYNQAANYLQPPNSLEMLIYLICKEIDSLQAIGHSMQAIANSNPLRSLLLRRLAESVAALPNEVRQDTPFHQLPFDQQMFYMNLCSFILQQLLEV